MKPWLIGLTLAAKSLDAASTCGAMAHGAVERNPLLPTTCGPTLVVQGAVGVGLAVVIAKLYPTHPGAAKLVAGVAIGSSSLAVIVNLPAWRTR